MFSHNHCHRIVEIKFSNSILSFRHQKVSSENMSSPPNIDRIVVTFGTFDLFHYGHLRLLMRAKEFGTKLFVGVSTDALNIAKKGRAPITHETHRKAIIEALKCVDGVFEEHSLEEKPNYLKQHQANVLVMGKDWEGKFDQIAKDSGCEVVYLERTPDISTTEVISLIKS
jgi:glycerol-3-phosphate cytidylyltransferase